MPASNQRRDCGEAPPKLPTAPVKAPVLPKDYGNMKTGYKRP